jgi:hypothetical protein
MVASQVSSRHQLVFMAIKISSFTPEHVAEVSRFNERLKAGGCTFQFSPSPIPNWLPRQGSDPLYEEYLIASDESGVRGGYVLKHQPFQIMDETGTVCCVYLPLSEGAVDRKFSQVGLQLLLDALKRQPLLYSLGMGSLENPYPKLVKAAGWTLHPIEFLFAICKPNNFLKNIEALRAKKSRAFVLDMAAYSGVGWLGIQAMNFVLARNASKTTDLDVQVVKEFGTWADELWQQSKTEFTLCAVRDAVSLNRLYPVNAEKFFRLVVRKNGIVIGWVICLDTRMTNHKQFGGMRVGSIIDCLAAPGQAGAVATCAYDFLKLRSVDIVLTNQSNKSWADGFRRLGFLSGPTNFFLALSPKLAKKLAPFATNSSSLHFLRGDGEGPSHL